MPSTFTSLKCLSCGDRWHSMHTLSLWISVLSVLQMLLFAPDSLFIALGARYVCGLPVSTKKKMFTQLVDDFRLHSRLIMSRLFCPNIMPFSMSDCIRRGDSLKYCTPSNSPTFPDNSASVTSVSKRSCSSGTTYVGESIGIPLSSPTHRLLSEFYFFVGNIKKFYYGCLVCEEGV